MKSQYRRDPSWGKISALLKHMHKFDLTVWMSSNVMVTDMTKKLEDFLSYTSSSTSLIVAQHDMVSSGIMLVRSSLATYEPLLEIMTQRSFFKAWPHEVGALVGLYQNYPDTFGSQIGILSASILQKLCH